MSYPILFSIRSDSHSHRMAADRGSLNQPFYLSLWLEYHHWSQWTYLRQLFQFPIAMFRYVSQDPQHSRPLSHQGTQPARWWGKFRHCLRRLQLRDTVDCLLELSSDLSWHHISEEKPSLRKRCLFQRFLSNKPHPHVSTSLLDTRDQ